MTTKKICLRCKSNVYINEYYISNEPQHKDGLSNCCSQCHSSYGHNNISLKLFNNIINNNPDNNKPWIRI